MNRVDWERIDEETQWDLAPDELDAAFAEGVERGLRGFRRRLWLGQLVALAVVLGITATAFLVRQALHPEPVSPSGVPVVDGLTPSAGPEDGGTLVTITGAGFEDVISVFFGGQEADQVEVVADDRLVVTSPDGTGLVNVVVTTAGGSTVVERASRFEYLSPRDPPSIDGLDPAEGTEDGGTVVTIEGTGLLSTNGVTFDGQAAPAFEVLSDEELSVTTPSGEGAVDVAVTTVFGTADGLTFTYLAAPAPAPVVTGLDPAEGPESGKTPVTVRGSGFSGATQVLFGAAPGTDLTVLSDEELRITSPPGSGGVDVQVSTAEGMSEPSADDRFTYVADPVPPVVTSITPTRGEESGGTEVRIQGTDLADAVEVRFGDALATDVRASGDDLVVLSPRGLGTVAVTVVTTGGTSAVVDRARFTYVAPAEPPVVDRVKPDQGSAGGGTTVEIFGVGFTGATEVRFGSRPATEFTILDDGRIQAEAPRGGEGDTVDVQVTTPAGTSQPGTATYSYLIG